MTLLKAEKADAPRSFFEHWETLRAMTAGRKALLNSVRGSLPPLVCKTVRATLAAHGSSRDRALVMSTSRAGAFSAFAVYLVVTVTVNRCQIAVRVGPVLLVPVMDLQ